MPDKKRVAVQILYFDCDQFILKTIENCAPFVEKIFVTYSPEPWSAYNKTARADHKNPSNPEILKQSPYYSKIHFINGVWDTEEAQRNECLDLAKKEGFDFMVIQDADEFYNPEDYQMNLQQMADDSSHGYYRCPWYIFWKTTGYVVVNQFPMFFGNNQFAKPWKKTILNFNPCFAVNCKMDVRFKDRRVLNTKDYKMLDGLCIHLSYVMSDEQLERKLHTWGHSHQVDKKHWLATKWYGWTEETRDLNPISAINWPLVEKYTGKLPKELSGFNPGEQKYIKPSMSDLFKDKLKSMSFYLNFILKDIMYMMKNKGRK